MLRKEIFFEPDQQTILLDLENEKVMEYGSEIMRFVIHDLYEGDNYYESWSKKSGAGYVYLPPTVVACSCYIPRALRSREGWKYAIKHTEPKLSLDGFTISIHFPIEKGYLPILENEPVYVVIEERGWGGGKEQAVVETSVGFIFDILKTLKDVETMEEIVEELELEEKYIETIKAPEGKEIFYTNAKYSIARKFIDDRHLEMLPYADEYLEYKWNASRKLFKYPNFYPPEVTEILHVKNIPEYGAVLVDSFNPKIIRKEIDDEAIFAEKEEFEELFPKISILKDGDIRIVLRDCGKKYLIVAYANIYEILDEEELKAIYKCRTKRDVAAIGIEVDKIKFALEKEEIIQDLEEWVLSEARNIAKEAERQYKTITKVSEVIKEVEERVRNEGEILTIRHNDAIEYFGRKNILEFFEGEEFIERFIFPDILLEKYMYDDFMWETICKFIMYVLEEKEVLNRKSY